MKRREDGYCVCPYLLIKNSQQIFFMQKALHIYQNKFKFKDETKKLIIFLIF